MTENKEKLRNLIIKDYSKDLYPSASEIYNTAKLFKEVFSGPPWFETVTCSSCNKYFNDQHKIGEKCPSGDGGVLYEANSVEKNIDLIKMVLQNKNRSLLIASLSEEVVGFGWGYPRDSIEYITKFEKYSKSAGETVRSELESYTHFFSLAELGVKQTMRGVGLGKTMFTKLIDDASQYNLPITAWTKTSTFVTPMCLSLGFHQIFGPEVKLVGGSIQSTGHIINGADPEITNRVLFVK